MLRTTIKAILSATLIAGLATTSFADGKVGDGGSVSASFKSYMGQYDDGVDNHTAHFENRSEANVNFMGVKGSLLGFVQFETRDQDSIAAAGTGPTVATIKFAQYTKGAFSAKVGTVVNAETLSYALLGGTKTFALAGLGAVANPTLSGGYAEADGVRVGYKVAGINLGATIYGSNAAFMNGGTGSGQATQLTASGKVGPASFRFALTNSTDDDFDTSTDADALTDTYTHLGVKMPISIVDISFDYATRVDAQADDTNDDYTDMALQVAVKEAGPGKLILTYASQDAKEDGEAASKTTNMNLVYDIPIEAGAGIQIIYLSKAFTPEGGDTTTSSFIGSGLYASF